MTTLARIAAEAYRTGLKKRRYYTSGLDDTTLKDILAATQESLDAVFKELDIWVHPDFPGWIALTEHSDLGFFVIRNKNVMAGMAMTRDLDKPNYDEDYDEGFSAAYRAAHKPEPKIQRCPAIIHVNSRKTIQCAFDKGHTDHHSTAIPADTEAEFISW